MLLSCSDNKLSPMSLFNCTVTPAWKRLTILEKFDDSYKNFADSSFS